MTSSRPGRPAEPARPDILICAGLDPSGGAGLIADVRVVSELGGRPVGVVTALTVQNTTAVIDSDATAAALVREQLEFLLSDVEVRAVKIGMIGSSEVARSIGQALALTGAPVVWDPVMHPSRGAVSFIDSSFGDAAAALLPHVTVLTPNAAELAALTGAAITSVADAIAAGRALAARLSTAVLVKGGHLERGDPKISSTAASAAAPEGSSPRSPDEAQRSPPAVSSNVQSNEPAGESENGMAGESANGMAGGSANVMASGSANVTSHESVNVSSHMPVGESANESIDVLCRPGGIELLRGPRVPGGEHVHGTGCALSSALATYLALGLPLVDACRAAKAFVASRIAAPVRPGRGASAIV